MPATSPPTARLPGSPGGSEHHPADTTPDDFHPVAVALRTPALHSPPPRRFRGPVPRGRRLRPEHEFSLFESGLHVHRRCECRLPRSQPQSQLPNAGDAVRPPARRSVFPRSQKDPAPALQVPQTLPDHLRRSLPTRPASPGQQQKSAAPAAAKSPERLFASEACQPPVDPHAATTPAAYPHNIPRSCHE